MNAIREPRMRAKTGQKGQIYSLDFLIAAGLLALALGMLLGFFETAAYEGKEARTKNELAAIALTAGNVLLGANACPDAAFRAQGYRAYGCYNAAGFGSATKSQLLIPAKFRCRIELNNSPTTALSGGCRDDPVPAGPSASPAPAQDIGSSERKFLSPFGAALSKNAYEKCIAASINCLAYTENTLTVRVWPE